MTTEELRSKLVDLCDYVISLPKRLVGANNRAMCVGQREFWINASEEELQKLLRLIPLEGEALMAKAKEDAPMKVTSARWNRLERRLTMVKSRRPKVYSAVVEFVANAADEEGLSFPLGDGELQPSALIEFIKQLLAMMPSILTIIEALIALFL